jgi:hypothetical protein
MSRDIYKRPVAPENPIGTTGPALGNVPTPDSYLRVKQNIEGIQAQLENAIKEGGKGPLTLDQLKQVQEALQANGPNPLNLTALPGVLLQPQKASIPSVTTLPTQGSDGQAVLYRHVIWRFSGTTRAWSPASTILLLDYEYNLSNYAASDYAPGVMFVGSNTGVMFIEQDLVINGVVTPTWVPEYSSMVCLPHVDRQSSGTVDTSGSNNSYAVAYSSGTGFRSEMLGQQIWIAGNLYPVVSYNNSSLLGVSGNVGNLTGASYYFSYPSINYPKGALFYETDRTVLYRAEDASGNVSVSGGNSVAWTSGVPFDPYWTSILIGNNNYAIATVAANKTQLTLATTAPNGGAGYSVPRGAWFYTSGIYSNNNASIPVDLDLSTDLGFYFYNTDYRIMTQLQSNSGVPYFGYRWGIREATLSQIPLTLNVLDAGYQFYASDYKHAYEWNGTGWGFSPMDSGSAYIVAGGPLAFPGGNWAICDGSTVAVAIANGTTANVITPNLTGDIFLKGGTYTGNRQAATVAKWANNASTDGVNLSVSGNTGSTALATGNENLHTHNIQVINYNVAAGVDHTVSLVNAVTDPGTPHNHSISPDPHTHTVSGAITPDPHAHGLSNNNAVLLAPAEGANNGGLPLRMALQWYMRR